MTPEERLDALSRHGSIRANLAAQTADNDAALYSLVLGALDDGVSIAEIARRTGYHRNAVRDIRRRAGRE